MLRREKLVLSIPLIAMVAFMIGCDSMGTTGGMDTGNNDDTKATLQLSPHPSSLFRAVDSLRLDDPGFFTVVEDTSGYG